MIVVLLGFLFMVPSVWAAEVQQPAPRAQWTARWISHPTAPLREPGVFHFRKVIHLDAKPDHFLVEISADNHFVLYVNGTRMGEGPAKGDLRHWRYETLDLAAALKPGDNVLAAVVWNFGIYAPLAVISNRTAFVMQGDSAAESQVNTDATWQVEEEPGVHFIPRVANGFMYYWAADPGEKLDAALYDWDWKDAKSSASSHWVTAGRAMRETIRPNDDIPLPSGHDSHNPWTMFPDTLPQMEFRKVSSGKVVRTDLPAAQQFPGEPVVIPAHTKAEILLDRGVMATGYPELTVSGGKGSQVTIGYAEALYDAQHRRGNRNEVGNRQVLGKFDEFLPDGGSGRVFMPLWFRTWRYLEFKVETGDEPLHLDSLDTYFSAFPFVEKATFASSDPELAKIWDICWRTARIDAHDTYMDTAFWEQLQYIEDTRIQSLISYAVADDDRLAQQALHAFDESRIPEGITQSRYPSLLPQFTSPFSLSYIGMLHDYWMYRPDSAIVRELVPGTRPILEWFLAKQDEDGFLENVPYSSRISPKSRSALFALMFTDTLKQAAELEDAFGDKYLAAKYRIAAGKTSKAVYHRCWNAKFGLLADSPDQNSYSQKANIYGVLTDAIPKARQESVMRKVIVSDLGEKSTVEMAPLTDQWQFYLARALDKAGLGDDYLKTIGAWREMIAMGFTTTPEGIGSPNSAHARSDTHAWSSHPIYNMLTIVAGIHPDSPGFTSVRITPHPGTLEHFEASMPYRGGKIEVRYRRDGAEATFTVGIPPDLPGVFVWNGRQYSLQSGEQTLRVAAISGK